LLPFPRRAFVNGKPSLGIGAKFAGFVMGGKRGLLRFCQRDVTRAFRAAKAAGIPVRVDIGRDGSLSVVPVIGPQPQGNEWDQAFDQPPPQVR
jgi:hypothetical protein